eukprot:Colp12_sorted_trinity150504_noHs@4325
MSALALFPDAVRAVLKKWTALRLAVDQGFGGSDSQEKEDWLYETILDMFDPEKNKEKVYKDQLEELFEDVMENEFNTVCDDGSISEVSAILIKYFSQLSEGQTEEVQKIVQSASTYVAPSCVRAPGEDDEDDDESGEEEEEVPIRPVSAAVPPKEPEDDAMDVCEPAAPAVDPDGWTTVVSKKKGGRR